jgi:hypothetical protein
MRRLDGMRQELKSACQAWPFTAVSKMSRASTCRMSCVWVCGCVCRRGARAGGAAAGGGEDAGEHPIHQRRDRCVRGEPQ